MTNSTGCYFYTFYRKSFFLQTVYAEQPFLSQGMISMKPWNMKVVSTEYREFPRQSPAGEYTPVQSPSPYSHSPKRYYTCSLGTEVWYNNTIGLSELFFFLSPFYSSSIQIYFFCRSTKQYQPNLPQNILFFNTCMLRGDYKISAQFIGVTVF